MFRGLFGRHFCLGLFWVYPEFCFCFLWVFFFGFLWVLFQFVQGFRSGLFEFFLNFLPGFWPFFQIGLKSAGEAAWISGVSGSHGWPPHVRIIGRHMSAYLAATCPHSWPSHERPWVLETWIRGIGYVELGIGYVELTPTSIPCSGTSMLYKYPLLVSSTPVPLLC